MADLAALLKQLNHHDEIERRIAIDELSEIGESAIDPLIDVLNDGQLYVRGGAALVLGQLSAFSSAERSLPILINMLCDTAEYAQRSAAVALAQFDDGDAVASDTE